VSSLLPPTSTALERALDLLAAMRVDAIEAPLRALWRAEACPEELLPWLAWALSIDAWDPAWPVEVRRARIAAAVAIQRTKGTRRSVSDVIASYGGTVLLREWWQFDPPAEPHTFELLVSLTGFGGAPSAGFIDQVMGEVWRTKPVRSHFTFTVALSLTGGIGLVGRGRSLVYSRQRATAPTGTLPPIPDNALTLAGEPLTLSGVILTLGS